MSQVLPYLHEALEVDDECSQKLVHDRQVEEVYELWADGRHEEKEHEVLDVLQDNDIWLIRHDFSQIILPKSDLQLEQI